METDALVEYVKYLTNTVKGGDVYYSHNKVKDQFNLLMRESAVIFHDKKIRILELKKKVIDRHHGPYGSDILNACKVIEEYLDKKLGRDLKEHKSFLGPADLIKKAGLALRQGQEEYTVHLCDTAVEAFLKDVFDVPSTIVGAGTVKFLSECMILDVPKGMNLYLKEVKNKVCQMDNQIKHKAYVPSRLDAINALKVTEELYVRRNRFHGLSDEEKRKVQVGIGLFKK